MKLKIYHIFLILMFMFFTMAMGTPQVMAQEKATDISNEKEIEKRDSGFFAEAETGLGYDSNIYLTPGDSYVDYAQPGAPKVDPDVQSGYFVPFKFKGEYISPLRDKNRYIVSYRLSGDLYIDPDHENANEYYHKLRAGLEHVFKEKGLLEDTLYVGPYAAYKKDVYFDRDTGEEKVTSTTQQDISDRYTYSAFGIEAEYSKRTSKVKFEVSGKYEQRDYEDPGIISQLDHTYTKMGGKVEFNVTEPTKLSLGYTHSIRDYDDKPSTDKNGDVFASNPTLKYTYNEYEASLRNRFSDTFIMYLDFKYKTREDDFEGYGDYTQNTYRVRAIYDNDRALRARLAIEKWDRKYPNAYAFADPTQDDKEYSATEGDLNIDYSLTPQWGIWSEINFKDQTSTDDRYEYERYQAMLGVKWEHK